MIFSAKKIKRPLAVAGLCYVATTAAAYFVSVKLSAAFAAAAFLYALFVLLRRARPRDAYLPPLLAVAFICLAALISCLSLAKRDSMLCKVEAEDAVYVVAVKNTVERGNALRIVGDVVLADGEKVSGVSVLFYIYGVYCEPGDELTTRLSLYPGAYDADGGVRFNAATPRELIQITQGKYRLTASVTGLKSKLCDVFYNTMPRREASVASALVTGERSGMSVSLSRMMQRAGVSHIVVVSGMHIMVLLGILAFLLTPVKSPVLKGFATLLTIAVLLVFYGFTASVIRACVMGALVFFGKLFYYQHDGATSLSSAAVLILLFSPSAVKNVSFQLSFACCLAIVTVYPFIRKRLRVDKWRQGRGRVRSFVFALPKTFLLSLTINIVTLPVLILNGIPLSLVSPLTNLLVVPLISPVMMLTLIAGIVGLAFKGPVVFPGVIASWGIRLILVISEFFAGFRYASVDVNDAALRLWALLAVATVLVYFLFAKRGRLWPIALIITLPLAAWLTADKLIYAGMPEIIFYEGRALILRDENETAVIIDRMTETDIAYLASYLLTRGIDRPDSIIVLRRGNLSEEIILDAFPHSLAELSERSYTLKSSLWVGRIRADIDGSCAIIKVKGKLIAVANSGGFQEGTDFALFWRGSDSYEDIRGSYVICYEDIAPAEDFYGRPYGFGDKLRLLVGEERVFVRA